jgi:hypothetical protein
MFPGFSLLHTVRERLNALVRLVTGRAEYRRRDVEPQSARPGPAAFATLVHNWLAAKQRASDKLDMCLATGGTSLVPGVLPACLPRPGLRPAPAASRVRLPRGFGWLARHSPETMHQGTDLLALLNQPWMKARILSLPGPMAQIYGPVLAATGIPAPEWFPKPPPRARRGAVDAMASAEMAASSAPQDRMAPARARREHGVSVTLAWHRSGGRLSYTQRRLRAGSINEANMGKAGISKNEKIPAANLRDLFVTIS